MPQQRRKLPFSGKKKKDQLLQKRQTKVLPKHARSNTDSHDDGDTTEDNELTSRKLMEQPLQRGGRNRNVNRYNLQFYQETRKDLELIKQEGYKTLEPATVKMREIDGSHFDEYDFPVRPKWDYNLTKELLDRNENRYFREYVDGLQKSHRNDSKDLSLFELNLETWRQLWRVLEISDIMLIIVDVRYSTLMFPPSLYKYIKNELKKHAILVLNKVDLVSAEVVVAWQHYFYENYPGLPVVLFASYPAKKLTGTSRGRIARKRSIEGVYNIYKECQKIVQGEVDLSTWEQKIAEDMKDENVCIDEETTKYLQEPNDSNTHPSEQEPHVMFRNNILTIGCIGFPNVGKSSLINALKGRKVVSVSRTPGHTKHFQTIFLTNFVRLCDCPGLVFPSSTPKHLQVLLGSFPISQLQVPYRSLKFLSEHLNLPQLLKIHLPEDFDEWSAVAVADAWALKRGFLTAKAARPDRYRAANHLLRMCLAGQQGIVLQFYPPGFDESKDKWLAHPSLEEVKKYQNVDDEKLKEQSEDTSSVNSETADSYSDMSESDEEAKTDDEDEAGPSFKSKNAFAMLSDDE